MSKGEVWRRAAQAYARVLWAEGFKGEGYQLMREVIEDARAERFERKEAA